MQDKIQIESFTSNCFETINDYLEALPSETVNGQARRSVLATAAARKLGSAVAVSYESAGKLLIIDDGNHDVRDIIGSLADTGIQCTVLTTSAGPVNPIIPEEIQNFKDGVISLAGYLGRFYVELKNSGQQKFDLILDLSTPAFLRQDVLPIGYYAPGNDPDKLTASLDELPYLTGVYAKPVFIKYRSSICAHGSRGIKGCNRCLDQCPANAIVENGDKIEVNTFLCQGCGNCTAVCPGGALTYNLPAPRDWLLLAKELLAGFRDAGGSHPNLLIHDDLSCSTLRYYAYTLPDNLLPIPVEAIGSIGIDSLLACLAYGAGSVNILAGKETPGTTLVLLRAQIACIHELLSSMGYSQNRVHLFESADDPGLNNLPSHINPAASFEAFEKDRTIELALGHLYQHAPVQQTLASLPAGAPFGEIQVKADNCTLCMSCVSACPVRALAHSQDQLQLKFQESKCVQCGLCANVCPEKAITLSARYIFDDAARINSRVVMEDEAFCCVSCGKPFISRRMFKNVKERLEATNRKMGKNFNLKWLEMCGECRTK